MPVVSCLKVCLVSLELKEINISSTRKRIIKNARRNIPNKTVQVCQPTYIYIYLYELKYLRNIVNYLAFNIQND